jgi:ketosteroid isomerase-like protein
MKRLTALAFALGLHLLAPQAALAQDAAHKAEIERVVETFRTAIINKDQDAFLKLFLKEDITWAGVTADKSIDMLYANRPNPALRRPPKVFNSNPRAFIESIVKDKARSEETFANLRIDSDGDVAQVWFDYSFLSDGRKENWGKESWQMVRTETGWKIAAVVWSQELSPTPPKAAQAK